MLVLLHVIVALTTNLSRPVWWLRQSIVSIHSSHFADTTPPRVGRISEMMKRMGVMGKPLQAQPQYLQDTKRRHCDRDGARMGLTPSERGKPTQGKKIDGM